MKALCFIILCVLEPAHAAGVVGFWKGESFSIEISGNKISGYWGKRTYDVAIHSDGFSGSIDETEVKIDNWKPDVTGKLPCGEVKINAWSSEVAGEICGESFITTTGNQGDSNHVADETATSALLNEFPIPSHGTIRNHIRWLRNDD